MGFFKKIPTILFLFLLFSCSKDKKNFSGSASNNTATQKDLSQNDALLNSIMSETIEYAKVYNLLANIDSHVGETVKVTGTFNVHEDKDKGCMYFAVLVNDSTACCALPMEFVLKGEHTFPNDYPSIGSKISVTGEFEKCHEGNYVYCRLKDATLTEL